MTSTSTASATESVAVHMLATARQCQASHRSGRRSHCFVQRHRSISLPAAPNGRKRRPTGSTTLTTFSLPSTPANGQHASSSISTLASLRVRAHQQLVQVTYRHRWQRESVSRRDRGTADGNSSCRSRNVGSKRAARCGLTSDGREMSAPRNPRSARVTHDRA